MKTNNTQQATPRPWVVDCLTRKGHGQNYVWRIQDAEGESGNLILEIHSNYPADDDSEKLARQIVAEHNEHAALLAVAEAARELAAAVAEMNTAYGASDFLPGDKSRRYFSALEASQSALANLAKIRKEG